MAAPSRFNVRVYGIWIQDGALLVNEEQIRGQQVIKFPGGGLELGEGPEEGLIREWQEELQIDIRVQDHYYTTGFFQPSAYDDSQVISIYYRVSAGQDLPLRNRIPGERSFWLPLSDLHPLTFSLPIDRLVGNMLMEEIRANHSDSESAPYNS